MLLIFFLRFVMTRCNDALTATNLILHDCNRKVPKELRQGLLHFRGQRWIPWKNTSFWNCLDSHSCIRMEKNTIGLLFLDALCKLLCFHPVVPYPCWPWKNPGENMSGPAVLKISFQAIKKDLAQSTTLYILWIFFSDGNHVWWHYPRLKVYFASMDWCNGTTWQGTMGFSFKCRVTYSEFPEGQDLWSHLFTLTLEEMPFCSSLPLYFQKFVANLFGGQKRLISRPKWNASRISLNQSRIPILIPDIEKPRAGLLERIMNYNIYPLVNWHSYWTWPFIVDLPN